MSAGQLEGRELFQGVFDLGRKYGVRPIPELVLMMVGAVTAEGVGKMLDPRSNTFGEIAAYLAPILAKRGTLNELMGSGLDQEEGPAA